MKILCVEDDQGLSELLQVILVQQHYQVEVAMDGNMAWDLAETYPYDLILLDLVLPGLDGIQFCQRIRTNQSTVLNPNRDTPILLMTALDEVTNKVMGLDAGADDYVVKPFNVEELLARIRALLRRNKVMRSPLLTFDQLVLNPNNCEVRYDGQLVPLTSKEYQLLELFLRNPDQIFSPTRLLDRLWTAEECPSEGAIRSHIKSLRKKLKQMGSEDIVETIYKLGYRLKRKDEIHKANAPTVPEETTAAPVPATVAPGLGDVWLECRQSYRDRFKMIQNAVEALENHTLTPAIQQEAEGEAHTLTGSLGSFGLEEASVIARQIQQIFKQKKNLGLSDLDQLRHLLPMLENHLLQSNTAESPSLPSQCPTALATPTIPSLLIIDDDVAFADQLAAESVTWGFEVAVTNDLAQAQVALTSHLPDVIIMDLNFSSDAETGFNFLATINRQFPSLPIVILTAEDNFLKRLEAARLGSQCFLPRPISPTEVLTIVSQIVQTANLSTARLLIVDDDPELLRLLRSLLEPCGYQLSMLDRPQHFWEVLEQTLPDLLILDIKLGKNPLELESVRELASQSATSLNGVHSVGNRQDVASRMLTDIPLSGIDLCKVIRSDPRWNRLPIIFLSAHTDIETIQSSFEAGADDFLSKPIVVTELLNRIRIRLEQRKLWSMAEMDELTGVCLRRKALQDLTRLFNLAKRQQQQLNLAILDLDHFKGINDQYGHETGDRVLRYVGQLLSQTFRQEDVVGRWGGEEFVIGMYGSTKENCLQRLENIAYHFSQNQFTASDGTVFQMTFSGGMAQFPDDGEDLQTLYRAADMALYRAKQRGRNRIVPVTE
ncbi:MAG: response regulator [Snowella sp.]|nr:response regulator [Snowella sp.]